MSDLHEVSLLGVDVGYSKKRATTGIAIYADGKLFSLHRVKSDPEARSKALDGKTDFDAVAIDGPMLPPNSPEQLTYRHAEKRLSCGIFQARCKPAASHTGFGLTLRKETVPFIDQFHPMARKPGQAFSEKRIYADSAIVEAFPNSFLGLLLTNGCFTNDISPQRGKKFDWLYNHAVREKTFEKILSFLCWNDPALLNSLEKETDHEKRAALICLLTAACAYLGKCEPVGDESGGWIFLPPQELWADWAREAFGDT